MELNQYLIIDISSDLHNYYYLNITFSTVDRETVELSTGFENPNTSNAVNLYTQNTKEYCLVVSQTYRSEYYMVDLGCIVNAIRELVNKTNVLKIDEKFIQNLVYY